MQNLVNIMQKLSVFRVKSCKRIQSHNDIGENILFCDIRYFICKNSYKVLVSIEPKIRHAENYLKQLLTCVLVKENISIFYDSLRDSFN